MFNQVGHIVGEEIYECSLRLAAYQYSDVSATGTTFKVGSMSKISLDSATPLNSSESTPQYTYSNVSFQGVTIPDLIIARADLQAITEFFTSSLLTGNITIGNDFGTEPGLRAPFLNGSVADTLGAVAARMTDHIRSGPGSQLARGSSTTSPVFVGVQWAWLGLPLFELLAAIALLALTMVWSRHARGVALWKSSSLALLFASYRPEDGTLRPSLAGPTGVEDEAKAVQARLQ